MDGGGVTSSSADKSATGQRRARQEGSNDSDPSGSQPPPQSSSSSDNTNGSFECNICLDQAQDAVVSRCGHLFCWPCLHQWLEVKKSRPVCPVCKAAVSRDSVIPLYGRGADHKRDPRDKVPPRPQGVRTEPESQRVSSNLYNIFGGNAREEGEGSGGNLQVSFGFGPFPFGLFATTFNIGGGGGVFCLSSSVMVRIKYRYLISIVSVGAPFDGSASRSVTHRPAYPGCHTLSSSTSVISSPDVDTMIYRAIRRSVQTAHGTFGVGRLMTRFRIIYWNTSSGLLIIRVLRGLPTEQLTSALSLITSVYDGSVERPAVIDVVHRSGTVRCCQKFIGEYYKVQLSGSIWGVRETAIARAAANRLIEAKPPDLT
ncbi:unnamed protein product [Hydatigera taeniaeformis]|uniref:RING-type E3 ubiquitin transferase n=1 Tax=Hydatigena taeniaeformis TaxID=6205 RepID=A0A158REY7_HYDTA|nr:unnamed protein product [Hydatigera taeniaeformis]